MFPTPPDDDGDALDGVDPVGAVVPDLFGVEGLGSRLCAFSYAKQALGRGLSLFWAEATSEGPRFYLYGNSGMLAGSRGQEREETHAAHRARRAG